MTRRESGLGDQPQAVTTTSVAATPTTAKLPGPFHRHHCIERYREYDAR
jgi:hypothetical protein